MSLSKFVIRRISLCFLLISTWCLEAAVPSEVIRLWPGEAPGTQKEGLGEERVLEGRPRPFYQITDVTVPTIAVFQPESAKRNGTAVLLCPGGGLQRLAIEHEGLEMAERLLTEGLTVFLLKYRVPAPIETALIDAQRAMGIIRSRAAEWEIDPNGIGQLGFSAGGEIGAWLATHYEQRLYEAVDAADRVSCKPDFVGLIYPGGLLDRRTRSLKAAIADHIDETVPPTFFVHAFDDSSQNSLEMVLALKRAGVPTEFHLYQRGTHGFGARTSGTPASSWVNRFTEWLAAEGFADNYPIRKYAKDLYEAVSSGARLPRLAYVLSESTLDDAYVVQKHYVKQVLSEMTVGGFKGAGASAAAQESMGIPSPLTGVLPKEGRLEYSGGVKDVGSVGDKFIVETEIGYVFGVDIANEILTDQQAKDAVEFIMPVIELPNDVSPQIDGITLHENISANIGSERFMVGPSKSVSEVDPNKMPISLTVDGKVLHETNGGIAKGGQWHNLRSIVNQLVSHGYTIPKGAVVICGALGGVHKAVAGHYVADFSDLGKVEFRVRP
jgi:2-keto-4-pentenoate hydratase/acetyl esterase/lipase